MYTAEDILYEKGHKIISTEPDTTIKDALKFMVEHKIGSIVIKEYDKIVGITEQSLQEKEEVFQGKIRSDLIKLIDHQLDHMISYWHEIAFELFYLHLAFFLLRFPKHCTNLIDI